MKYKLISRLAEAIGLPVSIFDTETTGVDTSRVSIVEVGWITVQADGSHQTGASLVNPGVSIPREATAVHGIGDKDVADAPGFEEVHDQIQEMFKSSVVSGFNSSTFDLPLVQSICERNRVAFERPAYSLDVRDLWIAFSGERKGKLKDVAAAYGVEVGTAHRALGDVTTTANILEEMLWRHGFEKVKGSIFMPNRPRLSPEERRQALPADAPQRLPLFAHRPPTPTPRPVAPPPRQAAGAPAPNHGKPWTPEDSQKMMEMWLAGRYAKDIGLALGRTEGDILAKLVANGTCKDRDEARAQNAGETPRAGALSPEAKQPAVKAESNSAMARRLVLVHVRSSGKIHASDYKRIAQENNMAETSLSYAVSELFDKGELLREQVIDKDLQAKIEANLNEAFTLAGDRERLKPIRDALMKITGLEVDYVQVNIALEDRRRQA